MNLFPFIIYTTSERYVQPANTLRGIFTAGASALAVLRTENKILKYMHVIVGLVYIINMVASSKVSTPSPSKTLKEMCWFPYWHRCPNPNLRLICFPWMGGDAQKWGDRVFASDTLPRGMELVAIEMPGYGTRKSESFERSPQVLGPMIARALTHMLEIPNDSKRSSGIHAASSVPYIMIGHGVGTWILYETLREIKRLELPLPVHVIISSFPSPNWPQPAMLWNSDYEELDRLDRSDGVDVPRSRIKKEFNRWDIDNRIFDPIFWGAVKHFVMADAALCCNYRYSNSRSIEMTRCAQCGSVKGKNGDNSPLKKCSRCRRVKYCSVECQRLNFMKHVSSCQRNSDDGVHDVSPFPVGYTLIHAREDSMVTVDSMRPWELEFESSENTAKKVESIVSTEGTHFYITLPKGARDFRGILKKQLSVLKDIKY